MQFENSSEWPHSIQSSKSEGKLHSDNPRSTTTSSDWSPDSKYYRELVMTRPKSALLQHWGLSKKQAVAGICSQPVFFICNLPSRDLAPSSWSMSTQQRLSRLQFSDIHSRYVYSKRGQDDDSRSSLAWLSYWLEEQSELLCNQANIQLWAILWHQVNPYQFLTYSSITIYTNVWEGWWISWMFISSNRIPSWKHLWQRCHHHWCW